MLYFSTICQFVILIILTEDCKYLEYNHSGVMSGSEQVEWRVCSEDPEALVFPTECVQAGAFGHVPYSDAFILTVGQQVLLSRVEQHTRYIVVVATARIYFPRLKDICYNIDSFQPFFSTDQFRICGFWHSVESKHWYVITILLMFIVYTRFKTSKVYFR